LDEGWVADALCSALAYLTAAAAADETGAERQLGPLRESCRYLGRRIEATER
jgi:hypothetical protein